MCGDNGSAVYIQRLQRGFFVHMAEVEDEVVIRHCGDELAAFVGQRTRFTGPAAVARARPGQADHAQTQVPPFGEFTR